MTEIGEIEGAKPTEGLGEFENENRATRAEDAGHFAEATVAVRHISEAEGDGDCVDRFVREGKCEAITLLEADIGDARIGEFFLFNEGLVEHGLAEVHTQDMGGIREPSSECEGDISASCGKIENVRRGSLGDGADEAETPPKIDPAA